MTLPIILALVAVILLAWLVTAYSFLVPPKKGLPILMYHKVSDHHADGLTIPVEKLDEQFLYLRSCGYKTLFFGELTDMVKKGQRLPPKTVVITFDDAYQGFATHALPLLEKYNLKATVFIPVAHIGGTNLWDQGNDAIMSARELKEIKKVKLVEFGLHSFHHRNFKEMTLEDMRDDLSKCISTLDFHNLEFVRVFAYPYGGYPRKNKILLGEMKDLFREFNVDFALRIGNRINPLPFTDPYELKRIDIKGTDGFRTFKIKLRKGRMKLFS